MKLKDTHSLEEKLDSIYSYTVHGILQVRILEWADLDSILKSRDMTANKGPSSQSYGFSSSHVWMWEVDHKESWALKNWCFWTVVLGKTLESPLDCKEIQPVNPQGNQSWIFTGKTDAEVEAPILWPPDVKNWLSGKDPHTGKDWRQEEKGVTEDEMAGWHPWLDGHQAPGVGDGQEGLACCSPWGHKESDTTEWLKWIGRHFWLPRWLKGKECACLSSDFDRCMTRIDSTGHWQ